VACATMLLSALASQLLTHNKARRIAVNIDILQELLRSEPFNHIFEQA
jgi:hypothetical protein